MAQSVNIGELIRQKLDESGMSYREFACKINCERQSLYYLFKCKSIDVDRLVLISKVLNYDFLARHYLDSNSKEENTISNTLIISVDKSKISRIDKIVINIEENL